MPESLAAAEAWYFWLLFRDITQADLEALAGPKTDACYSPDTNSLHKKVVGPDINTTNSLARYIENSRDSVDKLVVYHLIENDRTVPLLDLTNVSQDIAPYGGGGNQPAKVMIFGQLMRRLAEAQVRSIILSLSSLSERNRPIPGDMYRRFWNWAAIAQQEAVARGVQASQLAGDAEARDAILFRTSSAGQEKRRLEAILKEFTVDAKPTDAFSAVYHARIKRIWPTAI
jgi:hypothetical protein